MKSSTVKIVLASILSSLALITFLLESLFPPLFLPGAKLGLSNVFIILTFICLGKFYGFSALIIKCVLGSLFSGNFSAVMYSLPAGIIALTFEIIAFTHLKKVSVISICVVGSMLNITVQNITFCLITNSLNYLAYLPYLALIGACTGVEIGACVYLLLKRLPLFKLLTKGD